MPGPLSVTVTRKRVAWLAAGAAPLPGATSTLTTTSGRMPASSAASSALSTASLTQVRSALRGLSKPSRWRFLVKNSETEISRWRAPISAADTVAFGSALMVFSALIELDGTVDISFIDTRPVLAGPSFISGPPSGCLTGSLVRQILHRIEDGAATKRSALAQSVPHRPDEGAPACASSDRALARPCGPASPFPKLGVPEAARGVPGIRRRETQQAHPRARPSNLVRARSVVRGGGRRARVPCRLRERAIRVLPFGRGHPVRRDGSPGEGHRLGPGSRGEPRRSHAPATAPPGLLPAHAGPPRRALGRVGSDAGERALLGGDVRDAASVAGERRISPRLSHAGSSRAARTDARTISEEARGAQGLRSQHGVHRARAGGGRRGRRIRRLREATGGPRIHGLEIPSPAGSPLPPLSPPPDASDGLRVHLRRVPPRCLARLRRPAVANPRRSAGCGKLFP